MAEIFQIPGKILTGLGAVNKIKELQEVKSKNRALIITDQVRIDPDVESQLLRDLESQGLKLNFYNVTEGAVTESSVNKGLVKGHESDADLVISLVAKLQLKLAN